MTREWSRSRRLVTSARQVRVKVSGVKGQRTVLKEHGGTLWESRYPRVISASCLL